MKHTPVGWPFGTPCAASRFSGARPRPAATPLAKGRVPKPHWACGPAKPGPLPHRPAGNCWRPPAPAPAAPPASRPTARDGRAAPAAA
ncbi:hypothetical protein B9Z48_12535 [Limnohabitans sp. WS1]|nr:hypothetical protein B9Z48_12535 [Limnohabitans sp. WS1]